jgi:hypothetical protein
MSLGIPSQYRVPSVFNQNQVRETTPDQMKVAEKMYREG